MSSKIKKERTFNGVPYELTHIANTKLRAEKEKNTQRKFGYGVRVLKINEFGRTEYLVYRTVIKKYPERFTKRPGSNGIKKYGTFRSK